MAATLPVVPAVRFHLSLNVSDLERSVAFYRVLFGRGPAKRRADYAKFELDDPPLVLSLEPTPRAAGGPLNHAGFRMPDAAALVAMQQRLGSGGHPLAARGRRRVLLRAADQVLGDRPRPDALGDLHPRRGH